MWGDDIYEYKGNSFSVPPREILPRVVTKPHPPLWVACGNPATFDKAGRLGLGVLCFTIGAPSELKKLIDVYKEAVSKCTDPVGDFVNDNVMCVTHLTCLEDRDEALELNTRIGMRYYQSLCYRWLDSFPKPEGVPDWPEVMPEPTLAELKEQVEMGTIAVGDRDDCAGVAQQYAAPPRSNRCAELASRTGGSKACPATLWHYQLVSRGSRCRHCGRWGRASG